MTSPVTTSAAARRGLLQVCAAGVLWGTGGLVVTVLHDREGIGAMAASSWRIGLASAVLLAFAAATGRWGSVVRIMRTHPATAVLLGCFIAAYQGLYFASVLLIGVSVSTVVALGIAPILAASWEHATGRTRPGAHQAGVLVAALTGLVLISTTTGHAGGGGGNGSAVWGLVLALGAGTAFAATTVIGHGLTQRVDSVALTTCAMVTGTAVMAPVAAVTAATGATVVVDDATSWGLVVYLGAVTMALSYGLLYAGLRTTPGSAATVATLLEPVSAALLAVTLLGERLSWPAAVGGVLILAAVAALRPEEEHPTPA